MNAGAVRVGAHGLRAARRGTGFGAVVVALAVGAPVAASAADACAGAQHCRVDGPFQSQVVNVSVSRSGRVTAYQTVRSTVRFTNLGTAPLILAYKNKSATLTDDQGNAYRWSSKSTGIGLVGGGTADTQFQLAPGETREASIENTLQYSVRSAVPGTVYDQGFTIAQLVVVGSRQVRTEHEYSLNFPGLTATGGFGATGAAGAAPTAPAIGQMLHALKRLGK